MEIDRVLDQHQAEPTALLAACLRILKTIASSSRFIVIERSPHLFLQFSTFEASTTPGVYTTGQEGWTIVDRQLHAGMGRYDGPSR